MPAHSGPHLFFAAGRWPPGQPDTLPLLAHELAHVAQHAEGAPLALRCKPDPAPAQATVWYQEIVDRVALARQRMDAERQRGGLVFPPPYFDLELAILTLCQAVDAGDADASRTALTTLLGRGSLWVHLQILSRPLLTELSARMFELGLETEAAQLRAAYAEQSREGPYRDDIYAARRRLDYLRRLVAGTAQDTDATTPAGVRAGMRRFARVFTVVRTQYLAIDWEAVARERQYGSPPMVLRPRMAASEVAHAVRAQMTAWHDHWSRFVQAAMDAARADLETAAPTGSGATLLTALREALVGELREVLFPSDAALHISFFVYHPVTTTIYTLPLLGPLPIALETGAAAPSVPVTTYDPAQEWARELRTTIAGSWRTRRDQVHMLGRLHGVLGALQPDEDFVQTMANAEEAQANAASVRAAAGGRLRLDNDDDWRAFLLRRFNDLTTPPDGSAGISDGAALEQIVDLLFDTLKAFTVHARFTNLYDIGRTPYFNRPFPRTLTGQVVQDCGVYALRAAYMLSLVRQALGLRFFFVRLPAHVSLVISGQSGSTLPTFVLENNHYEVWQPDWLDAQRQNWEQFQDPATQTAPAGAGDDEQFIAELAAASFMSGPIDMPARVSEVPRPTTSLQAEQRQLWAYYQGRQMDSVFGPASQRRDSPDHLFHQRYLGLTESMREIHNEAVLPFWNETAPAAWQAFDTGLRGPDGTRTELTAATLRPLFEAYRTAFDTALAPLNRRMQARQAEQRRISERLRADPQLAGRNVRLTAGARASILYRYAWQWYGDRLARFATSLQAKPDDEQLNVAAIRDELLPGSWVPTERRRVARLD